MEAFNLKWIEPIKAWQVDLNYLQLSYYISVKEKPITAINKEVGRYDSFFADYLKRIFTNELIEKEFNATDVKEETETKILEFLISNQFINSLNFPLLTYQKELVDEDGNLSQVITAEDDNVQISFAKNNKKHLNFQVIFHDIKDVSFNYEFNKNNFSYLLSQDSPYRRFTKVEDATLKSRFLIIEQLLSELTSVYFRENVHVDQLTKDYFQDCVMRIILFACKLTPIPIIRHCLKTDKRYFECSDFYLELEPKDTFPKSDLMGTFYTKNFKFLLRKDFHQAACEGVPIECERKPLHEIVKSSEITNFEKYLSEYFGHEKKVCPDCSGKKTGYIHEDFYIWFNEEIDKFVFKYCANKINYWNFKLGIKTVKETEEETKEVSEKCLLQQLGEQLKILSERLNVLEQRLK